MPVKTIAVLTSGGDAPGMNAAVRAIAKVAAAQGVRTLGVLDGYDGLIDGRFRELSRSVSPDAGLAGGAGEDGAAPDAGERGVALGVLAELDLMGGSGGTLLGSARSARFRTAEGRRAAAERLASLDGLIVIGGDGSLTGAHLLSRECRTPIIGVPASIDNDIGCTASAIGVDTALNTVVDCCDRIADTAISHRRAFLVEVMGRHSGYLAMASAVAAGADGVLFREQGRSEDEIVEATARTIARCFEADRGKRRVLILKAEGVDVPCTRLVSRIERALGERLPSVELRATVLGHLVRGGRPTFMDRMMAARLGRAAVEAVLLGRSDEMMAWMPPLPGGTPTEDPSVARFALERVLTESKALLDGTSPVTQRRVRMMQQLEGVLGI
ncbi:MAG: 6-phosphofructokinase [Polyangia bacterium]